MTTKPRCFALQFRSAGPRAAPPSSAVLRSLFFSVVFGSVLVSACGPAIPENVADAPGPGASSGVVAAGATPSADAAGAVASFPVPENIRAIIDAADRSAEDRALDAGRHPGELLAFFGVGAGMKVAELGAGGGYTAELLARTVGPSGAVYGQNNKFLLERFAEKPWAERLSKPIMKNVVRVDRDFDEPLPKEAQGLDVVLMVLFYHDTVWLKVDRAKMNTSVFNALKPGGVFAIVDHSGRPGTGVTETESLHRIEEKAVREEIEKVGFRLEAEGNFLRNAKDTKDWNASPRTAAERRGTSDRFVLKFVKPL